MSVYKILQADGKNCGVLRDGKDSIPFAPDNTDYANFKTAILKDKAQLQDADGNTMTAEQAKDFVSTLP